MCIPLQQHKCKWKTAIFEHNDKTYKQQTILQKYIVGAWVENTWREKKQVQQEEEILRHTRPKLSYTRPKLSYTRPKLSYTGPKLYYTIRRKLSYTRPKLSDTRPKLSDTRQKRSRSVARNQLGGGGGHSPLEPLLGQIQIAKAAT